jgi:outer membrane biosynthesis protein TonB
MYFDLEDNHPDIAPISSAISWREGALLSVIVHLLMIILVILNPKLPGADEARQRLAQQIALEQQRQREMQRFVFVQPHLDMPAQVPPRPRAEPSDQDRIAQTSQQSPNPTNSMPFSRGNTPEKVEALAAPRTSQQAEAPSPPGNNGQGRDGQEGKSAPPSLSNSLMMPQLVGASRGAGSRGAGEGRGVLGTALRDLQRYVSPDAFENQGGSGAFGPSIQFDTKGVEFGPWIRRFVAQIKRNWFIPYAAMAMKGHVVITFYVMKDGRILELGVPGPCPIDAFNNAAYNALVASNPTQALPPEYPADRAFFTVTFYYNETPPSGPPGGQ